MVCLHLKLWQDIDSSILLILGGSDNISKMAILAGFWLCMSRQWNAGLNMLLHWNHKAWRWWFFSRKQVTQQDCLLQVLPSRQEQIKGIQWPVLAPEDLKHRPYLWSRWCCSRPGHWLTHRQAAGSGHHTVLLAGLKVCGSLSGFEEEQLCEKRWKHHTVNLMAPVLKEQGSSVPKHAGLALAAPLYKALQAPTHRWD